MTIHFGKVLLFCCAILFSSNSMSQEINPEIFRKNIDLLYESAAQGFKEVKGESIGTADNGDKKFHSTRKISGAKDVYILVDEETSHTYIAQFTAKDLAEAKETVEKLTAMILEQLADKGFHRSSGTQMGYEGYRKQTVEFASDNIDLLGKYPSFSVGIIKGTTPPIIELVINEPLWK